MYQHGCPRHGYAEWFTETGHHSMALFATKHAHISLPVRCGNKQGSLFACPCSNEVASFKSKAFFPPPQLPHRPLVDGHAFQFHSQDMCATARHLILIIHSYCEDDTHYTAALLCSYLITQVQWSRDHAEDFSLITKLGRKHNKCSVVIINHPHDEPIPSFDSTVWSYDHAAPYTYLIATHTVTSIGNNPDPCHQPTSATTRIVSHSTDDVEYRGYSSLSSSDFFGIPHTLTGDITQAPVK